MACSRWRGHGGIGGASFRRWIALAGRLGNAMVNEMSTSAVKAEDMLIFMTGESQD